jgi:REP element-mobilizing transposase RayT
MARIARVVAPGLPHHITQRGNRRQATFFGAEDYHAYIALIGEWCRYWHVEVWEFRGHHTELLIGIPGTPYLIRDLEEREE